MSRKRKSGKKANETRWTADKIVTLITAIIELIIALIILIKEITS